MHFCAPSLHLWFLDVSRPTIVVDGLHSFSVLEEIADCKRTERG